MCPRLLLIAAWIGALGGCGADRSLPEPAAPPRPSVLSSDQATEPAPSAPPLDCAIRTPDTKVRAQLIDRGAALVFTTKDDVASLRRRAADVTIPRSLQNASPRIDNVHNGVRLVFETQTPDGVEILREEVVEHARQVAKGCGLVLGAPSGSIAPEPRRAQPTTAPPPRPLSKPKPAKEPPREPVKKATKPAPKPATKPKPPPATKPPPAAAPSDRLDPGKSKGEKKPLPRLPGPQPEPIAPR